MNSNTKNRSLLVALVLAALLVPAQARDDVGGGPRWLKPVAMAATPWFARDMMAIEPAAGGRLLVATVPSKVETPALDVPAPAASRLGAFESVAISAGSLPFAKKWRGVTSSDYSALFTSGCDDAGFEACDSRLTRRLRAAHRTAASETDLDLLRTVNLAVNGALPYGSDRANWGQGDYWATPAETLARGIGDCEDFAVMKMWMLRSLGFDPAQLQIVVLEDTKKRVYHAVLAVHLHGEIYILDNLNGRVSKDTAYPSYLPIMSFVAQKSYIHGFDRARSETADMPDDLTSVMPGEGA